MKILHITSLGYEAGGAESGIVLVDDVLRRKGHTVRVLASDLYPDKPHFNTDTFHACAGRSFLGKCICRVYNRSACRALRKVLAEFKPDVVQLHTTYEVSPAVLFLLREYPTILTAHGAEDYTKGLLLWGFPPRFFKDPDASPTRANLTVAGWLHYAYHHLVSVPVYRYAFRYVDRVLVVSRYMQDMLRREGLAPVCIPNATNLFTPAPLDPKSMTILYVGRLEKIKGVQYAIEALVRVRKDVPDARLIVAGTGTYVGDLRAHALRCGVAEQVDFVGHKNVDELYTLYKESAVVVVPSVWPEPFGKVGIEAMSVGRAVVASDVGGIGEWLTGGATGYLVPPSDAEALAEKLVRILTDDMLRERMSTTAVTCAQKFSIERYVETLVAFYEEVCNMSVAGTRQTPRV
ncbi:MAG: glycosyltransferase family 4 protein [Candidatus Pacebacteria bacterium]|nr:glycosyltransferase family 4 protein [Candidatus Paceibacterota bacterium]